MSWEMEIHQDLVLLNENLIELLERTPTLRDYFAGQALTDIASICTKEEAEEDKPGDPNVITEQAYGIADAMLKAREVKVDDGYGATD